MFDFLGSCHTNKYEGIASVFQQDPINMWYPLAADNDTYDTNDTLSANETSNSNNTNNSTKAAQQFDVGNNSSAECPGNLTNIDSPTKLELRFVEVSYTTADETVYSTDRLVDFASFISSVGGNLGLFLGFSFLGILFDVLDKVEAYYITQFD